MTSKIKCKTNSILSTRVFKFVTLFCSMNEFRRFERSSCFEDSGMNYT